MDHRTLRRLVEIQTDRIRDLVRVRRWAGYVRRPTRPTVVIPVQTMTEMAGAR